MNRSEFIAIGCPTLYGRGAWPIIILNIEYTLCLLASAYQFLILLKKRRWYTFQQMMKLFCLLFLTLFLFLKSLFHIVIFPHNKFTDLFFCDQLPRLFIFIAFEFLILWLGSVVFKGVGNYVFCGVIVPFVFMVLTILGFFALLIFSIIISDKNDVFDYSEKTALPTVVNMSILCITLLIYIIRFSYIFSKSEIPRGMRGRLLFLLFALIASFSLFLARMVYNVFDYAQANAINQRIEKKATDRCFEKNECTYLHLFLAVFYTIFDTPPAVLLLVVFSLAGGSSSSSSSPASSSSSSPSAASSSSSSAGAPSYTPPAFSPYASPSAVAEMGSAERGRASLLGRYRRADGSSGGGGQDERSQFQRFDDDGPMVVLPTSPSFGPETFMGGFVDGGVAVDYSGSPYCGIATPPIPFAPEGRPRFGQTGEGFGSGREILENPNGDYFIGRRIYNE